ncbi:hypothetical protein QJS04_geneDACA000357 [Acorus gramineus]|uniref:Uncharacterized protein n=1 Tax=Acorus gramineus TaxID=55184 RepID=A0AAV9ATI0_ACOGR|nr:hypothetical protein QJS04_geneDACA000357 [Acorus gramineus]
MVEEPRILSNLRRAFSADHSKKKSSNNKNKKKKNQNHNPNTKDTIGILSFEVASVMSKTVHLHRSLSDAEITRLKSEVLRSDGVRNLVSTEEPRLLSLALSERLDDLNCIASVVSRIGKRCSEPALLGFEHVYADVLAGRIEVRDLGCLVRDMDSMVKKLERYVASTISLYNELEALNELEQAAKKFQPSQLEETRRAFEQKIVWQRHDVGGLRDLSLWNQTYDKAVGLLARAVFTIYARIRLMFGDYLESPMFSGQLGQRGSIISCNSGLIDKGRSGLQRQETGVLRSSSLGFPCGSSPGRLFMECLSLSNSAVMNDHDERFDDESRHCSVSSYQSTMISAKGETLGASGLLNNRVEMGAHHRFNKSPEPQFSPKSRLIMNAPPTTIGGSALALHYANVILIIEKLLRYPHLVGEEARDDLYQMLPTSLRTALRMKLKSYVKNLAIYDAPLAHDWKERLDNILRWLAPMAHNMIRWQTERNFEQHQIVTRANVLLLQTLYFADREKTEATICELLVGLNYICRYEHQQNALLDCRSSVDFDECMEWQLQY